MGWKIFFKRALPWWILGIVADLFITLKTGSVIAGTVVGAVISAQGTYSGVIASARKKKK